jgi:hypothetical protein
MPLSNAALGDTMCSVEHESLVLSYLFQVTNYLLDTTRLYDDEQTYKASLDIEPKMSRLSMVPQAGST